MLEKVYKPLIDGSRPGIPKGAPGKSREDTKMRSAKTSYVLLKIGLVLLLIVILLPTVLGSARQSAKKLPAHYPETFSGQGCIDQIAAQAVVINDRLYKLSADVTFNTLKMQAASRSWFRPGRLVGFVINSENEIESLWYIQRCR
jgi:predicted PurR-regulated permease PerM